jgi:hypothetical protein
MNNNVTKLNSADYLPREAYRRNHEVYELVCYVNCLIGCRISGNTEGEELFKSRVKQYMDNHPPTGEVKKYYDAVSMYVDSN